MSDEQNDTSAWIGHQVVDRGGDKVGKVTAVYSDDQTRAPLWVALSTGGLAKKTTFVPARGAAFRDGRLVIAFSRATVKKAPLTDDNPGPPMDPEVEKVLYLHYGRGANPESQAPEDQTSQPPIQPDEPPSKGGEASQTDRGTPPPADDIMVRSEEQITLGTQTQESGRARLHKYVVTEPVSGTVRLLHEEVRVERQAITDAERPALEGVELSAEEHEIVLYEQRPVVEKTVVPVERVQLSKETVAGRVTIHDQVRRERIELDGELPADEPREGST